MRFSLACAYRLLLGLKLDFHWATTVQENLQHGVKQNLRFREPGPGVSLSLHLSLVMFPTLRLLLYVSYFMSLTLCLLLCLSDSMLLTASLLVTSSPLPLATAQSNKIRDLLDCSPCLWHVENTCHSKIDNAIQSQRY